MVKIIPDVLECSFVKSPSRVVEIGLFMLANATIVERSFDFTSGVQANL